MCSYRRLSWTEGRRTDSPKWGVRRARSRDAGVVQDMNDFSISFGKLQAAVDAACQRQDEWPAKLAAGIYASLDFAIGDPAAARTLIVDIRLGDEGERYRQLIECFSEQLGQLATRDERLPVLNEALVGSIAAIVADHVRSERLDRLPAIAPELVNFALLPYLGFDEAKRWTKATART